jgi:hypothetical protein
MQELNQKEDKHRGAGISRVEEPVTLVRPGVFDPADRLVFPPPWIGHIPFAFWIVDVLRPSTFVELGTHSGNSYSAFCQAIQRAGIPSSAFAVDTWKGDEHANLYGEEIFTEFSHFHDSHFAGFSRLVRSTFDDAVNYFSDSSIDLLHIDGLHTYDAVKHDFETWLPKLSSGGVVLFHDINVRENEFGVWKYWQELTTAHPYFRFDHCNGLGVLGIGRELPIDLKRLFHLSRKDSGTEATLVRQFFSILGSLHLQTFAAKALRPDSGKQQRSEIARDLDNLWKDLSPQFSFLASKVENVRTEQSEIGLELTERFESSARVIEQGVARIGTALDQDRMLFGSVRTEVITAWREDTERLRSELALVGAENERLRSKLALGGTENERLRIELAVAGTDTERLRSELALEGAENERLQGEAKALLNSWSWRITAPMRKVSSLFKRGW